jgi:hypothetical protein
MHLGSLRGYMLEEAIACLVQSSGYDLLTRVSQDPDELVLKPNGLNVRGRGADHQADTLGQLAWTPAFSHPIRLFVEAKHLRSRVEIDDLREALGVLQDVNSRYVTNKSAASVMARRYLYRFAFFSASGFSSEATNYALAHEISLVDLSGKGFETLLLAIEQTAEQINQSLPGARIATVGQIAMLRATLRAMLGTSALGVSGAERQHFGERADDLDDGDLEVAWSDVAQQLDLDPEPNDGWHPLAMACNRFASRILQQRPLLLGMPTAPFVLVLRPESIADFLRYATDFPTHEVKITWDQGERNGPVWIMTPREAPDSYRLTFGLPAELQAYVFGEEQEIARRALRVKSRLLTDITVYHRDPGNGDGHLFRLTYEPRAY